MIMLTDDDQCRSITVSATQLLSGLVDVKRNDDDALPPVVYGVAARIRALDDETGGFGEAYARVPTHSGAWVTLHGTRSTIDGEPVTVIIVEPGRAPEIAPLIVRAYGLSERERQITQSVLRGLSTAEIAGEIHLSPLTVQDYLKSVFAKAGVRSRRELVARVFLDHYAPHLARNAIPGATGFFTETS